MNKFIFQIFRHYRLAQNEVHGLKGKFLDFGCGSGRFIGELDSNGKQLYGFDTNSDAVRLAKQNYHGISFKIVKVGQNLPYSDEYFDGIFMFHVLEHVGSENQAISEVHRILKPNGLLLLASPYAGLFTWADAANLRYRFPNLHKYFFIAFLGRTEYEKKFVNRQSIRMYGDCTGNRNWHRHYAEGELYQLLKGKFVITKFSKFSLFHPFLLIPYNVINYLFKPKFNPMLWLIYFDNLIQAGNISYNFFLVAKKR